MSKVISFRLNPNNPREAEALNILHDWSSQGFSTRQTITEALRMLNSPDLKTAENKVLIDLADQIKELLENVEIGLIPLHSRRNVLSKTELSDGFVSSIIRSVKPGISNKS